MWLKVIFVAICFVQCALSFMTGGGTSACETLMPNHGDAVPQITQAPVTITQSHSNIPQGGYLTVTVTSSAADFSFRGFMVQARSLQTNKRVIGRFVVNAGMRTVNCPTLPASSVATHTTNDDRTSFTFIWQAYTDYLGPFNFL